VKWLVRRLAHSVVLLLAVSLGTFLLSEWAPGDFLGELRLDPRLRPETVQVLRARHGLDRPLPERYLRWAASVLRGEMGFSFAYGQPAGALVAPRARNTLVLTAAATALAWAVALPLGTWWARRRGALSLLLSGATTLMLAVPDVVASLALLFAILFCRFLYRRRIFLKV